MNDDERIVYRSLLAMVLQWHNFDGDGITDPLRKDIIESLAHYKARLTDRGKDKYWENTICQ